MAMCMWFLLFVLTFCSAESFLPQQTASFWGRKGGIVVESTATTVVQSAEDRVAVVVGGGPVGLATALTLSNAPHYYDVTVIEQAPRAKQYDPTKAYLYFINMRGQEWTSMFPVVQERLKERGFEMKQTFGKPIIVPGSLDEPLSNVDAPPPDDNNATSIGIWIPRHSIMELMEDVLEEQERKRVTEGLQVGSVRILSNQQCESIKAIEGKDGDSWIEVEAKDKHSENIRFLQTFRAKLLVGADGQNSAVRQCLADDTMAEPSWLQEKPSKFRVRAWTSPSSGLRMKVLQFPPNLAIPIGGKNNAANKDNVLEVDSQSFCFIRSINKGPKDGLSLGLLGVKHRNMVRPAGVITRPNHDIWKLKNAQECKEWFFRAFPRLKLGNMVSDEEWERFYHAQGTTFPKCQRCDGLQVSHPVEGTNVGVVLVGDAVHAFPPDIGQGINAGFGDVVALDRALKGRNLLTNEPVVKEWTLKSALREYERVRSPEIRALIRLARFGSPYQYRQPLRKDRFGRFLWTCNLLTRVLLNKASMGILPSPAIMGAMDNKKTYRKLMREADLITMGLTTACLFVVWRMLLRPILTPLM